jgi:hypothetical protein
MVFLFLLPKGKIAMGKIFTGVVCKIGTTLDCLGYLFLTKPYEHGLLDKPNASSPFIDIIVRKGGFSSFPKS